MLTRLLLLVLLPFISGLTHAATAASPDGTITSTLVPGQVAPNGQIPLIWQVKLQPHWHIYWHNAGDSGLPPELKINTPGWQVSPLAFPTPKVISLPPITNYGYENEVLLHATLTPPPGSATGIVELELNYLYCKDICLPGTNKLSFNVAPNPAYTALKTAHDASLPKPLPAGASLGKNGSTYTLNLPAGVAGTHVVPGTDGLIDDSAPQTVSGQTINFNEDSFQPQTPPRFTGVLLAETGGYELNLPVSNGPDAPTSNALPTLGAALFFAFVAGLILNLMPCVLPVLALKVLSLVRHHHGPERVGHTLAYTAGVLASFAGFALLIYALQQGGASLGWGFHLQNPGFVGFLALLMVAIALNLFGVFDVGEKLTGLAGGPSTAPAHGARAYAGSAFTGVLAVVVATPCTVPFMGSAMAFALNQGLWGSLATFTALGLGMAAPFILLAACPGLLKKLPKPGAWMATFKHALGWPMLATAFWLLWVFSSQTNSVATFGLLGLALMLALSLWVYGRKPRFYTFMVPFVVVAWGLGGLLANTVSTPPLSGGNPWQTWSTAAVDAARAENRPVFIDFTADWCITCKVTEATVLNTTRVHMLFATTNTALFKADWTKQDPAITAELLSHNRRGVPLYLLYLPGQTQPRILPQLLTPALLEAALAGATASPR